MGMIRQRVTQGGADTFTSVLLALPALDGKSGYEIMAIEAYSTNGAGIAAADWIINAQLSTQSTIAAFNEDELIAQVSWAAQNTAGVAVCIPFDSQRAKILVEPRITVQPAIYVAVSSANTAIANIIDFRVFYNTIKLTELEYLRMLTGGA